MRRVLLAAFLLGSAAMAGAQTSALKGHDSNAPIDFSADRIELQDRADRGVLSGNVDVTQGNMRLKADRVTIAYNAADHSQVNRMDANGNVVLTSPTETARSQFGIYDLQTRLVTMIGGVILQQPGKGETRGNRLVFNLDTGFATLDGGSTGSQGQGGRVSGRFTPPPRKTN